MKVQLSVAAALLMLAPAAASAQLALDSDEEIFITGDTLEGEDEQFVWTGNVRVVQGEAVLVGDRLEADIDENREFQRIRMSGGVRYSNGKEAITGERLLYDDAARTITVVENVIVTQGKTVMAGGELVYWIDTGRFSFKAPAGQRIRGVFHTKSPPSQL